MTDSTATRIAFQSVVAARTSWRARSTSACTAMSTSVDVSRSNSTCTHDSVTVLAAPHR